MPFYEDVANLVTEKFNVTSDYASAAFEQSMALMAELASIEADPIIIDESTDLPLIAGSFTTPTQTLTAPIISFPSGSLPDVPEYGEPIDIDDSVPIQDVVPPEINLPSVPVFDTYTLPAEPDIPYVEMPPDITLTFRAEPVLNDVIIPASPEIVFPSVPTPTVPHFNTDLVIVDFDISSIISAMDTATAFLYSEITNVASTILDLINNPRMAIDDATRELLIARDLQKLADDYDRRYTEQLTFFSTRGWNTPQGPLRGKLTELDRLRYLSEDNIVRDYTIKDWELAQQNMQNALAVLPQYTNTLVTLINSILEKAISVAKYALEISIEKYKAAILVYQTDVDVYKTAFMVYEIQLKAQSMLLELYNAQLQSAKLEIEVNGAVVDLYKLFISTQTAKVDLYRAQIDGAIAKISASKNIIDLYKAQIDAYMAGLSTNNAKVELYKGQLAGEESRVKVYNTQMQGYAIAVDAAKTRITAQTAVAQSAIELNKNLTQQYEANIHAYTAQVQAASMYNDAETRIFMAQVGAYEAIVKAASAQADVLVKEADINMRNKLAALEIAVKQAEVNMHTLTTAAQLQLEAIKGAASVSAQLTASSLSAVTAGAQIAAKADSSASTNYNYNISAESGSTF